MDRARYTSTFIEQWVMNMNEDDPKDWMHILHMLYMKVRLYYTYELVISLLTTG
jgi:hypothetical protein